MSQIVCSMLLNIYISFCSNSEYNKQCQVKKLAILYNVNCASDKMA